MSNLTLEGPLVWIDHLEPDAGHAEQSHSVQRLWSPEHGDRITLDENVIPHGGGWTVESVKSLQAALGAVLRDVENYPGRP